MLKVAQQQLKCIKNFTPLRIVTSNSSKNTEFFSVLNTNGEKIGNFKIAADQYVSDLEIEPKFRRTKTSANALLSIKEFVDKGLKQGAFCNTSLILLTRHIRFIHRFIRNFLKDE